MANKPDERTYHRKYVGILTELNGFKYFVPMSSPKDKDYESGKIKKNNCSETEFPVGKIVIDFKKVEEACMNYKK